MTQTCLSWVRSHYRRYHIFKLPLKWSFAGEWSKRSQRHLALSLAFCIVWLNGRLGGVTAERGAPLSQDLSLGLRYNQPKLLSPPPILFSPFRPNVTSVPRLQHLYPLSLRTAPPPLPLFLNPTARPLCAVALAAFAAKESGATCSPLAGLILLCLFPMFKPKSTPAGIKEGTWGCTSQL